jgi:hypothetical protein
MTRCLSLVLALGFAMLCAAPDARAQENTPVGSADIYELVLRDGSRVYGTIQRETQDEVVLQTASGVVVTAKTDQILELKRVKGRVVRGEFQRADPTPTRLFFGPTARQLKRGEAYLGVFQVLMPNLQVGITDRISVGGGTPLLFFGDGDEGWERPFWLTPKVQLLDTGRVQVAAGVFHGLNVDGDGGGIGYGVVTTGSEIASITAGAGVAYSGDGGRSAVVMVGGDRQVSRNVKIITENYFWKGGDGIVSVGFRFFGEQLSADLGVATPIGADDLFLFPVVNFVYSF